MRARSGLPLAAAVAALVFAGIALAADDPPTPVITGTASVGETLTASGATIFKWQRCDPDPGPCAEDADQNASGWQNITAQESDPSTYTLTLADEGMMIRVLGKDTNEGTKFAPSKRVGPVDPPPPATAKLELRKEIDPTTDPGTFNLFAKQGGDTKVSAMDVGHNGTSGAGGTTVESGPYDLSEEGAGGTNLSDYSSDVACKNRGDNSLVPVLNGSVTLEKDADVVCTITNSRLPQLKIAKDFVGGTTSVDLKLDGATKKTVTGDDDTGFFNTTAGNHTVSEGFTGDDGASFDSKVECDSGKGSTDPGTSHDLSLDYGDSVTCTITNSGPPPPPEEEPVEPVAPPPPPEEEPVGPSSPPPPPEEEPLGPSFQRTGTLEPLEGTVLFKFPGSNQWVELQDVIEVPMGTKVDVSNGHVLLITQKKPSGALQSIELWAGTFVLQQKRKHNITVLTLANSFAGAVQSRTGDKTERLRKKKKRRLWGRGKCRCRHRGRNSSGTSRGTWWLTVERPRGTLTKVKKGKVQVRDFKRRKKVLVKAGHKYLARR